MKIRIEHIKKQIKGVTVINDVNMELESGNIYGLVGKNGSGKTMLLRMIAGMVIPSEGKIYINDEELDRKRKRKYGIGLLLENAGLYPEMTGYETLDYLGHISGNISKQRIDETLEMVGLDPNDKRTVKKYSLGMRQKLSIAQAILEKPELILMDEPTNGLDADSAEGFRRVLRSMADDGSLVIIASHNMEDITEICDKIYLVSEGKYTETVINV